MSKITGCLIFLCSYITLLSAAVLPTDAKKLEDKLNEQRSSIRRFAASLHQLEKQIGQKNDEYLKRIEESQKIEEEIAKVKSNIHFQSELIQNLLHQAGEKFNNYLLAAIDDFDDDALLIKQIKMDELKKHSQEIKRQEKQNNELLAKIENYEQKILEYKNNEESLQILIKDLEENKRLIGTKYLESIDEKAKIENLLDNYQARNRELISANQNRQVIDQVISSLQLMPPLANFKSYVKGKKGITFKYNKTLPLHATESGTIVYSGELATYGQVLMIDHGNDVRSVILGDLKLNISKGMKVHRGEMLGQILCPEGESKSLYFELRKKNIAQDTLSLFGNGLQNSSNI
jgi:septal ring factor EnvC (AmiA/AmiB activator)